MKHLLKTTIAAILLSISIQATYATEQTKDLLIINNEERELLTYPLESYFSQKGISNEDIPWLDKTFNWREALSTDLYRGYRATWKVENDSIFLIKIENGNYTNRKKGNKSRDADLKTMFGEKYKDGKVFADWINEDLFTQFGFFINRFMPTMQSMEIKYTVNKGIIQSITKYSTLTGKSTPNVIRIWTGKELDTESAKDKIYTIVSQNFKWSKEMTENRDLTVVITIGNNFSNTVLGFKQNELKITYKALAMYKKNLERKNSLKETDKSSIENSEKIISKLEKVLPKLKENAEEEDKKNKSYLDELTRVLKPLKIETVLFRGKPFTFKEVELHFRMDAKNKTITKSSVKPINYEGI